MNKIGLKIAIVVILNGMLGILMFAIYSKAGNRTHIYEPIEIEYIIKNENKECKKEEELIYEDNNYNYYLTCLGSNNIYLEYTDGSKNLVKDALNSKKVTIDSLVNHGLEIVKHEK